MELTKYKLDKLQKLQQQVRAQRRELQALERLITTELNSRLGVQPPPKTYRYEELSTDEKIQIGQFSKERRNHGEWIDFVGELLKKRKR